jgi:peptidoglycan/LPS O-acetylase OafA/YrhL
VGFPFYADAQLVVASWALPDIPQVILQIIVLVAFSVFVGWLMTAVIENPFLALRKRILTRWKEKKRAKEA